jgi:cobalt-zinc-cadmium efflux system outer membrane protein
MRTLAFLVVLVSMALPWSVNAGEGLPAPLRWADIVSGVVSQPGVQGSLLRARAAEAGVSAAGAVANPGIEARIGRAIPGENGGGGLEWGLGLEIPFDWLATRGAAMGEARADAESLRQESILAKRDLLGVLAGLFWKAVHDRDRIAILGQTRTEVTRLRDLIETRVRKGDARPTELTRIEIERERVNLELVRARGEAQANRRSLAELLGVADAGQLDVEAGSLQPAEPPEIEDSLRMALSTHARLTAAQARVQGRNARVRLERARRIPGLSLGAYLDREPDRNAAGGMLRVELPVWNWNTAEIRRAEAARDAEEKAVEAAQRQIRAEVASAWERCFHGKRALEHLDREVVSRVESNARTVEQGFALGEFTLFEVLDARRMLLDVRRETLASALDVRLECTALGVLTGGIDDAE